MVIDAQHTVNGAAEWVCSYSIMDTILSNTIFASLMLTVIVVIILLGCYYNTSVSAGGIKKQVRTVFYLFLGVLVAMYVHHYALGRSFKNEQDKSDAKNTFKQIINPALNIGTVHAVVPNISDTNFEISQRRTTVGNSTNITSGISPAIAGSGISLAITGAGGISPAITGGGDIRRTIVGQPNVCWMGDTCAMRGAGTSAPVGVGASAPAVDDLKLDEIDFGKSLV